MSAIEDLRKAREAVYGGVWTWERHGDGWALYVNRGLPLDDSTGGLVLSFQHGLNILTVGSDGFDSRGEQLRAFILAAADKVPALPAEQDARDDAWARLVKAERDWHDETLLCDGERSRDMKGAYGKVDAAREALRELGVDVDTLLEET